MGVLFVYPTVAGGGGGDIPADAPFTVTLEDWSTGSAVEVGSLSLDQTATDLTFEDTDMQTAMGTVGVRQSLDSIAWGNFEFGAIAFDAPAQCNSDLTNPLYQVLVGFKPINRWASYPARDTWVQATDEMFPPAFKVVIKKQDGTVLHTHEMHDGLPINDSSLNSTGPRFLSSDEPFPAYIHDAVRPHVGLGSLLPWQSAVPSMSPNQPSWFPGVTDDFIRPSSPRLDFSANAACPLSGQPGNINGHNNWFIATEWPQAAANGYAGTYTVQDTFLHETAGNAYFTSAYFAGWGYEPGAYGCHDHMTGPGGPRCDRGVIPTPYALLCSDPTYVRPKDSVPIRDAVEAWGKTYFNFPCFWLTDVKTFAMLPNVELVPAMEWANYDGFYSGAQSHGVNGSSQEIKVCGAQYNSGISDGRVREFSDAAGRHLWNAYSRDYLHSYNTTAWHALLINSPMHVFGAKAFFQDHILANLGQTRGSRIIPAPAASGTSKYVNFLNRMMAWNILHLAHQWKLATTNALMGFTRTEIQDWLVSGFELLDTEWRQPILAATDAQALIIQRFGIPGVDTTAGCTAGNHHWSTENTHSQAFYMAHVMQFMKVSGCWDAVYAASTSAADAMDWIIECLDKYSLDYILSPDTAAYEQDGGGDFFGPQVSTGTTLDTTHVYADWAAQAADNPTDATWDKEADGTFVEWGRSATQHLRIQYACMRRDYFPDYANANLTDAIAAYQAFIDARIAHVDATVGDENQTNADWAYAWPHLGAIKAVA